jgi:glycosyltransferase involved in cell wall biosynthesis
VGSDAESDAGNDGASQSAGASEWAWRGDVRSHAPSSELLRLHKLVDRLGLRHQVHFAGPKERAELRYYYSAADVCVASPWYGAFGTAPVEAMACARPVIGAEVGKLKTTVVDGETGFLVPPRDPDALCERLAVLRANPALAASMGDAGLRRAYQHHVWRALAQKITAIYGVVAAQRNEALP